MPRLPPIDSTKAAVASRLVKARQAAGIATSRAVAVKLGMRADTYALYERGDAAVRPSELKRYASVLGVSHGWLATGIGSGPKSDG